MSQEPLNIFEQIEAGLTKPKELDKFQIATARFIDTVHGHLCGNHPATSIDNARATCELMSGIAQHLKRKGLLPSDISLLYSRENATDEEPSDVTRLTDEMYKLSRKRSNCSKHADKDAHRTLSYDPNVGLDHLLFNMAIDYERLHSALIKNNLLETANENLYPVEQSLLSDVYEYQQIYRQKKHRREPWDTIEKGCLKTQFATDPSHNENQCMVSAGAATCIIFCNDDRIFHGKKLAKTLRELGVWPVDVQKNASIKKEILSQPQHDLNK